MRAILPALLLVVAAGCGGGGGSGAPPVAGALRVQLDGSRLGSGQREGTVTVRLAPLPAGAAPVLLEGELAVTAGGIEIVTASSPLERVQTSVTLDGEPGPNGYRVLFGDGETAAGTPFSAGELFRVRVQTKNPRTTGPATVRLSGLRVVDAAGNALPLAAQVATAEVVVE